MEHLDHFLLLLDSRGQDGDQADVVDRFKIQPLLAGCLDHFFFKRLETVLHLIGQHHLDLIRHKSHLLPFGEVHVIVLAAIVAVTGGAQAHHRCQTILICADLVLQSAIGRQVGTGAINVAAGINRISAARRGEGVHPVIGIGCPGSIGVNSVREIGIAIGGNAVKIVEPGKSGIG